MMVVSDISVCGGGIDGLIVRKAFNWITFAHRKYSHMVPAAALRGAEFASEQAYAKLLSQRNNVKADICWMQYVTGFCNYDGLSLEGHTLNLPSDIVPATLKKSAKPLGRPMGGPGDRPRGPPRGDGDRPRFGDRDGYRSGPRGPAGDFSGDKGGAPADYQPAFNRLVRFALVCGVTAGDLAYPFFKDLYNEAASLPLVGVGLSTSQSPPYTVEDGIGTHNSWKTREFVMLRRISTWQNIMPNLQFLRTYLNLPSDIVPATLKKSAKPLGRPMGGPGDCPRHKFKDFVLFDNATAFLGQVYLALMECIILLREGDGDRPRFGDRDGYLVGPEDLLVISVATKVELLLIISLLLTGQVVRVAMYVGDSEKVLGGDLASVMEVVVLVALPHQAKASLKMLSSTLSKF
ncbi:40S ribosomal protein S10-1-like protein [Tanacetum coccineum]|uniref:40S ribosomal protein S10-1-like protein n=1 Tax=Tanacetum coccineum TaxID=301880 RepID=A0ABQ5HV83_9ASTR